MFFNFPILAFFILVPLILAALFESWKTFRRYRHLPWIGMSARTWWKLNYIRVNNFLHLKRDYTFVADKYWAKGQACFYPMLMGDLLILPPDDFEWMVDQPDESLDIHAQLVETTQAVHTLMSQYSLDNPTHNKTVSRDLTRRLGDLTQDIVDELALAIDDEWGKDTINWKEVNPFTTLIKVVARTSNRVFVGAPLCRNPQLIDNAIAFANTVIPLTWVLRSLPEKAKPILAPLITYQNRSYRQKIKRQLKPEIEARLKEAKEDPEKRSIAVHNDFLQWTINGAFKSDLPRETEADIIFDRVIVANFAAIHTSTISITNAVYDLVSPPSSQDHITALREEVNSVISANQGVWTKSAISQMTKIDSALKESARVSQLSAFSFVRRVAASDGITTPVSNTYLPKGAQVGIPVHTIHRNPEIYPDPNTYQPFRFAEQRSAAADNDTPNDTQTRTPASALKASALAFTATSPHFQTFSHGRHACPGRFFASNELKLLMAYILQKYEFDILEERPETQWIGQFIVCPLDKTIRIRRREKC